MISNEQILEITVGVFLFALWTIGTFLSGYVIGTLDEKQKERRNAK